MDIGAGLGSCCGSSCVSAPFPCRKGIPHNPNITSDERYILFLDGNRIGQGPERGDSLNWFYETVSLRLSAGNHVLVAQVWAIGAKAPQAQMSVAPGFFLREEGETPDTLSTGIAPWEVKPLAAYRFVDLGGRVPATYTVGPDLEVDGGLLDWGFHKGSGSGWQPAQQGEVPKTRLTKYGVAFPGHFLRKGTLPPMLQKQMNVGRVRHADHAGPEELKEAILPARHLTGEAKEWQDMFKGLGTVTIKAHQHRRVVVDLENYYCAYPMLQVSGGKGASVIVRWAESLYVDVSTQRKDNRDDVAGKRKRGQARMALR